MSLSNKNVSLSKIECCLRIDGYLSHIQDVALPGNEMFEWSETKLNL